MTEAEFYKYLGIMIACSQYRSMSRQKLFNGVDSDRRCGYMKYPQLNRFMSLDRFDRITSALAFVPSIDDPKENTKATTTKIIDVVKDGKVKKKLVHSWKLFEMVITSFNTHRVSCFTPGSKCTVDEKISKWKGKDDRYIEGNQSVRKISRKPEPIGNEILSTCCSTSGVCFRIELASSKYLEPRMYDEGNNKGTAVVQRLLHDYRGTGRTIYGDSAFASVNTCIRLLNDGLHFIGPVKTATKLFPRKQLQRHEYEKRGASVFLEATIEGKQVFATGWADKDVDDLSNTSGVKTFVSTCGTSLEGKRHIKKKWFSALGMSSSQRVDYEIDRDATTTKYFEHAGAVDYHNRYRQDFLGLERGFPTKRWPVRLFSTVFGICVTDSFFSQRYFNFHSPDVFSDFGEFVLQLSESLIARGMTDPLEATQNPQNNEPTFHTDNCHMKEIKEFLSEYPTLFTLGKNGSKQKRCSETNCKRKTGTRNARSAFCCPRCTVEAAGNKPMELKFVHAVCRKCRPFHKKTLQSFDEMVL